MTGLTLILVTLLRPLSPQWALLIALACWLWWRYRKHASVPVMALPSPAPALWSLPMRARIRASMRQAREFPLETPEQQRRRAKNVLYSMLWREGVFCLRAWNEAERLIDALWGYPFIEERVRAALFEGSLQWVDYLPEFCK